MERERNRKIKSVGAEERKQNRESSKSRAREKEKRRSRRNRAGGKSTMEAAKLIQQKRKSKNDEVEEMEQKKEREQAGKEPKDKTGVHGGPWKCLTTVDLALLHDKVVFIRYRGCKVYVRGSNVVSG